MRTFLNVALGYLVSTALLSAGVKYDTWQFWVVVVLVVALVAVQYIPQ